MPDLSTLDPITGVLVIAIIALAKVLILVVRGRRNGKGSGGSRDNSKRIKEVEDNAEANSREIARLDERTKLIQNDLRRFNDHLDRLRRRYDFTGGESIAYQEALKLMEMFEEHDDIQKIYTNFDIPDDVIQ